MASTIPFRKPRVRWNYVMPSKPRNDVQQCWDCRQWTKMDGWWVKPWNHETRPSIKSKWQRPWSTGLPWFPIISGYFRYLYDTPRSVEFGNEVLRLDCPPCSNFIDWPCQSGIVLICQPTCWIPRQFGSTKHSKHTVKGKKLQRDIPWHTNNLRSTQLP